MTGTTQPLADRIRPRSLDEFVGQAHLVTPGKPIYQTIRQNRVHSMIFWGPPGVGKTTLAQIIAKETGRRLHVVSAVAAGKNDIRAIIDEAQTRETIAVQQDMFAASTGPASTNDGGTILFLDEIHRFNKAQQDFLLPYVEDGTLTLIGATTENPSFEVIPALLSRSQVFVLESLTLEEISGIIDRGAVELNVTVDSEAREFLASFANGDARQALNLLENTASLYRGQSVTVQQMKDALQSRQLRYDKSTDEHYNTISAFIKSMRASNVDAALYYLARMVEGGEDPKFIARRMVIFASEDVGMADPNALALANAVFRAVETIGYPEAQINLAHGTAYLANSPKSKDAYTAYFSALDDVRQHGNLPIPLHLRNAPTRLMRELGYGEGYEAYTSEDLLPDELKGRRYFTG